MRLSKIIIGTAVALMPLLSQAARVNSDPTLAIGGMTFDDFSCTVTHAGFAGPSRCGKVHVSTTAESDAGLQFDSRFRAHSNFFNSSGDAVIGYHVSSAAGINHIGLAFGEDCWGGAYGAVTENVYAGNQLVGSAYVTCGPFRSGCTRSVEVALNGTYTDLWVTSDIDVTSSHGLGRIRYINETFDPTTPAPEPAPVAMLAIGLSGALVLLRRPKSPAYLS